MSRWERVTRRRLLARLAGLALLSAVALTGPASASALPQCSSSQPAAFTLDTQYAHTALAWGRSTDNYGDLAYADLNSQTANPNVVLTFAAVDPAKPISHPFTYNAGGPSAFGGPPVQFASGDGDGILTWTWQESTSGLYGPPGCQRSATALIHSIRGTVPKFIVRLHKHSKLPGYLGVFNWVGGCPEEETSMPGPIVFTFKFDGYKRLLQKADQCDNYFHGYNAGPGFSLNEYGGPNRLNLHLGFPKSGIHGSHRGIWQARFAGRLEGKGHFSFNLGS